METQALVMIWKRELIRLMRDRAQIAGSLARPILWLVILGLGMGSSFPGFGNVRYVEYLFPGIVALNLLFASFLSAISIIWDREFGFLKEMLVAPISRTSIAVGKAASGATVAFLQGCLVLVFIPLIGVHVNVGALCAAVPIMLLVAFSMTSLGLMVASRMTSFEGFGTIANFLIMPMFFLSGAIFPLTSAPRWIAILARMDPMTYAVESLRAVLIGGGGAFPVGAVAVLLCFTCLTLSGAVWAFCRNM